VVGGILYNRKSKKSAKNNSAATLPAAIMPCDHGWKPLLRKTGLYLIS